MNENIKPSPRVNCLANRISRAQKQRALTLIGRINLLDRWRDRGTCPLATLSRNLAAAASPHAVAINRELEKERKIPDRSRPSWLASLSDFSERTIRNRLTDLERLQAVHIHTPAIKGPCTYRLLPFGNGCRSSGNGCRTFGNREASPLPSLEEQKKGIQTVSTNQTQPRTIPDRIAAENQLKILRSRFQVPARDTREQWQCDANPGLVTERIRLRNEITARENALL